MASIVNGNTYGEEICKALGIDMSKGKVCRVVIDVRVDEAVRIYLEMFGTDELVNVKLPTTGIEIMTSKSE